MRLDSFFEGFVKEARSAGLDDNSIRRLVKEAQNTPIPTESAPAKSPGILSRLMQLVSYKSPEDKARQTRMQMIADALKTQERVTSHRLDTAFMKNIDNYNKGLPPALNPRGRYYV